MITMDDSGNPTAQHGYVGVREPNFQKAEMMKFQKQKITLLVLYHSPKLLGQ
ncbi:hypothetical protein K443DRAFT_150559 [Laccaria amethystina LaAM-08-1]|uniref:Uncharacterized protein n=1 Tax=Laccaria amethystina LaAM-08-1 TaxID=1095629 RepID=A0A0C9XRZ1_9AGAR|nr:hypothetical protein K443DRAFT_150559 [Laccaria amethystina LaAM-08-1]